MTISLLIPVRDFDIIALVRSMKSCLDDVPELIEIIIGDDGSTNEFQEKYCALGQEDDRVRVIRSEKNIGRAAIRNRMVMEAKGEYLLFMEADAMIPGTAEAYIRKWFPFMACSTVICGGIMYRPSAPVDPEKILRWKYGYKKEQKKACDRNKNPYSTFTAFNVMINRLVFNKLQFDEELVQYGHEDTLFAYQLKKAGINILHIDNELYHEGLETNREFLYKTKQGIENLNSLYDKITDKTDFGSTVRIIRQFNAMSKFGINFLLEKIFIHFHGKMELHLSRTKPKLWVFRFYKTCMFCTLRNICRRKK